jgi:hypothetical protein
LAGIQNFELLPGFTEPDFTGTSGICHTLNDASSAGENPDILDEFIATITA